MVLSHVEEIILILSPKHSVWSVSLSQAKTIKGIMSAPTLHNAYPIQSKQWQDKNDTSTFLYFSKK